MGMIIQGATGDWEVVIGLEVHAQVSSNSKLFSGSATEYGADQNTQVSFVDAAMPGMLPVINEMAVEQAVRTGLGLKAKINKYSVFDRKNYFYADLPQGYQISQFLQPIVGEGTMTIELKDGEIREIGITRLHLEQDAGKSIHDQHPSMTLVDLNRSGVALMEIVSEPDLRSPEEAAAYVKKLRSIVRYLGTCDGNMDEGSMRADVNVSVRKFGDELGTRCEMKNLNSMRFIQQAIVYEANRQVDILEAGGKIKQETRLYDSVKGETRSMRSKEEAHDYRYFPDPDLLPLQFDDAYIEKIKADLPELPDEKKARFIKELKISDYDAGVLVAEKEVADFFEVVAKGRDAKLSANWIIGDFFGNLKRTSNTLSNTPVSADSLGALIDLVKDGTISNRTAKEVLEEMFDTGKDAAAIVDEKGLKQVSDTGAIEAAIDTIIAANLDKVEQYRGGKDKLLGFFVGQVMKATGGKANPGVVNQLLKPKLDG
ncbi:MAG: Asp-tRNA(Asn)/Glu-tRNA(Gln) amidotransferase subunit GatB [Sneathiella sp.]|nr:Asp-tRNA(Asn)/Glu-tRNA(Gln) amidotransferase subunit GatB [Sneathiella sp.]